jgi:hypothetical protein
MEAIATNKILAITLSLIGLTAINQLSYSQNSCQGGGMSVQFDLSKTNNPSIKPENTYIVTLGINPLTKKYGYVQFNNGNSIGTMVDINNGAINGKNYGVPLSKLIPSSGGKAQACIPHLTSGRIYLSFGNALDMPTDTQAGTGIFTPRHPDVNNPQTTTGGTLFDKVEFNYSTNGETVINPTGVDFIAIPYSIQQSGHNYGHLGGLDGIIKNMQTIVCRAAGATVGTPECTHEWNKSEWSSLVVYNQSKQLMRIDAPGRVGNKFSGYFDKYIDALSNYYTAASGRSIKIDLRELGAKGGGIWVGTFLPNTKTLVFTPDGGKTTMSYNLDNAKASNSILMGAQAPFNNKNAIDATLARDFTSAIVSGMLMRTESAFYGKDFFDGQGNPVFKNKEQMQKLIGFYFNNGENSIDYNVNQCGSTGDAPCIDVYSEAIHALTTDQHIDHPQDSYVSSYAFAYDDFLGMDGTNTQTDASPATIIIGDMSGRTIPHVD